MNMWGGGGGELCQYKPRFDSKSNFSGMARANHNDAIWHRLTVATCCSWRNHRFYTSKKVGYRGSRKVSKNGSKKF